MGEVLFLTILDMHTNEILSYDLSLSPNLEQIHRMMEKLFEKHPRLDRLIIHSDQGWQYQHEYYLETLWQLMESFNQCQEKEIAMIIVLWKRFSEE